MKLSKEAYECFAYSVLKQVVSGFPQLTKGESPDYYDDELGLEVTRAISTDDGEFDALINQYLNESFSTIPKKRLKKLALSKNLFKSTNTYMFSEVKSKEHYIITETHKRVN